MSERYKRANRLPPGGATLEVSFPLRVGGGKGISEEVATAFFFLSY